MSSNENVPIVLAPGIAWDPALHGVWRLGTWIPLSPVLFRLLRTLCRHRGQVVPTAALLRKGWPGGERTPADLHRSIYRLRQIVESDPQVPQTVVTHPLVGYRLVRPEPTGQPPALGSQSVPPRYLPLGGRGPFGRDR